QTAVCEVVGVVGSVRESIFGGETEPPHVYIPFGQQYQSDMQIHLKVAAGGPETEKRMLEAIRHEIHSTDERLPLLTLTTMRRHLESSVEMWWSARARTYSKSSAEWRCSSRSSASMPSTPTRWRGGRARSASEWLWAPMLRRRCR